ncbi:MAG: hypothetical protein A2Y84_00040 [Candidatus Colwellbacteria bacterium RBG_13_48_8]|uniref:Methyltransferase type 11 domain-containing protein n=1 Tax=Candidatus Colwellbacteria bacterium RBG_13_48_8 TaxID=1797685 RepID=A0A1G1YX96_9BACT|nr:MAG: hypothetical protein A2Y84_00040 [Candidatus Colwellbacteria bacterium RBG_13_48_8]
MATKSEDLRAKEVLRKITPYLRKNDRILDVGSGSCVIAKNLKNRGYKITLVDVVNRSVYRNFRPVIYDGEKIPFADNHFDVALLITVLHHTQEPIKVLKEARRVAPRIVVMEDLHKGFIQKYLTFAMDNWTNRRFWGNPHTNMTQEQWEDIFKKLGLKILDKNIHRFWRFFTSGTFYLERINK